MNIMKTAALTIAALGVVGLLYGTIESSRETPSVEIGAWELTASEHPNYRFPIWLGIGCVVIGAGVFVFGDKIHRND